VGKLCSKTVDTYQWANHKEIELMTRSIRCKISQSNLTQCFCTLFALSVFFNNFSLSSLSRSVEVLVEAFAEQGQDRVLLQEIFDF
jgi:hypothetical protein